MLPSQNRDLALAVPDLHLLRVVISLDGRRFLKMVLQVFSASLTIFELGDLLLTQLKGLVPALRPLVAIDGELTLPAVGEETPCLVELVLGQVADITV